jgi:hypothetical protein
MKHLYQFTVNKEVETEKSVDTPDGKLITKVKEKTPVSFIIKKPSQQEITESTAVYASKINEFMARGIFPVALMAKFYEKNGGLFAEEEVKHRQELSEEFQELSGKYVALLNIKDEDKTKENLEEITLLSSQLDKVYSELQSFKIREDSAFANTAEVLAKNHIIFWWFLNTLYKKIGDSFEPVFGSSKDFKKQEEKYYELEDSNDPFYIELFTRSSRLVALWYAGEASSEEDFLKYDPVSDEVSEEKLEEEKPSSEPESN